MSNKAVCCTALLFANILLLVHVVVPHHHHEGVIACFNTSHNHEHPTNPSPEKCCFIDNIYIFEDSNTKNISRSLVNFDGGPVEYSFILNRLLIQVFTNQTGVPFRQNPYVPIFYSDYVSQSNGLRAPPAC